MEVLYKWLDAMGRNIGDRRMLGALIDLPWLHS
jgi:hypothetical protein